MRNTLLFTLLAGLTGVATAGGPTIVIDDFDSDPNDAAGGPRSVSTQIFANPFNQAADFTIDTAFSYNGINGAAIFNSGIGVEQEARLLWDNNGAGLGLGIPGLVGFELDFLMVDLDFSYIIEISSAGGSIYGFGTFAAGGERTESLAIADFGSSGSFDASAIDSISILFNHSDDTTASLDFILTQVRAVVPTPGSAALLGVGAIFAARRRR